MGERHLFSARQSQMLTPPIGISLWLVPNEEDSERIRLVMQNRPTAPTNSPSSFPTLHPHITLATTSDAGALRAALPPNQPAVPVRFKSVDVGNKYFMSVYVAVHSPDGSPLETLRAHLRIALGDAVVPPLPHLSLYYIDEEDRDARVRTLRELHAHSRVIGTLAEDSRSVTAANNDGTVGLGCHTGREPNESGSSDVLRQIEGEEIWLVRCEGPVEGWEVLEKFPLRG